MVQQRAKTPAEFVLDMPEEMDAAGPGAGPGAPETVEPRTGRPGNAGHGPAGERDSAPQSWVKPADPRVAPRDSGADSQPDPAGLLGAAVYVAQRAVLQIIPGGRHG
jgi:hypothetical protein